MTRKVIFKYSLLYLLGLMIICSYVLNHSITDDPFIKKNLSPVLVVHNEFDGVYSPYTIHSTQQLHQYLVRKVSGKYQFIHSLQELVPSDNNKNDMIDPSDPVYETLYLATLDIKTKQLKYQPLHETIINAINLTPAQPVKVGNAAEVIIPNNHQASPNLHMIIETELFAEDEIRKLQKS